MHAFTNDGRAPGLAKGQASAHIRESSAPMPQSMDGDRECSFRGSTATESGPSGSSGSDQSAFGMHAFMHARTATGASDGHMAGNSQDPQSAPIPESVEIGPGGKRQRSTSANYGQSERSQIEEEAIRFVPFTRTTMGSEAAAAEAMMSALVQQISTRLQSTLLALPAQVANALPEAIRAHEESEAYDGQMRSQLDPLRDQLLTIQSARSVHDLAKLPGWTYDPRENHLVCNDCWAFAKFAPPSLKGSPDAGIIKGTVNGTALDAHRGLNKVKYQVKEHIGGCAHGGGLHKWCKAHAAHLGRIMGVQTAIGLNVGRMALQCVKEHDSDISCTLPAEITASVALSLPFTDAWICALAHS